MTCSRDMWYKMMKISAEQKKWNKKIQILLEA